MSNTSRIRIGAVEYLNTRPLVYGLGEIAPQAEVLFDLPGRLADRLAADDLDVALIPSIEFFGDSTYRIVSDACIACRGPVLSVKLFSRVPAQRIRTLALDEGSRTSAALVQILLREKYGTAPRLEPLPIGATIGDTRADAALLIGDRAIHSPPGQFAEVWDLGDEWVRWAGLPFVFAMWVARGGRGLGGVEQALCEARDRGMVNLDEIASREAAAKGLTVPQCLTYLRDNLHFYLGAREREGLAKFHQCAIDMGICNALNTFGWHAQNPGAPGMGVERERICTPFADSGRATRF